MARRGATGYFVLMQGGRDTDHVFTGSQPRRAALKAATRGFSDIKLRERGTDKVHVFRGSRRRVPAPENAPDWLPSMVWRPFVSKVGINRLRARRAAAKKRKKKKKARRTRRRPARRRTRRTARRRTRRARRRRRR